MHNTKIIFFLSVIYLFSGVNVFAQERDLSMMDKNSARWSLGVKGGIDYFFVQPYAERDTKFKTAVLQASWMAPVIFAEITHNDIFSYGLESGYFAYNRGNKSAVCLGGTIDAALYASFNLSNIADRYRYNLRKRISWYGQIGLGAGYYHYKNLYSENGVSYNREADGFAPLAFLGATCAINLSDNWELFFEGQYRAYFQKNMGGQSVKAFTNAFAAFGGVRVKFW
ncbi:MAG: hypothetical protein LBS50_03125 [Prevotellaceae bacterium]|jgi:hypothetical protein|nr:hypothetical protein [Prevotellaceae bacterium]